MMLSLETKYSSMFNNALNINLELNSIFLAEFAEMNDVIRHFFFYLDNHCFNTCVPSLFVFTP